MLAMHIPEPLTHTTHI